MIVNILANPFIPQIEQFGKVKPNFGAAHKIQINNGDMAPSKDEIQWLL